VQFYDLAFPGKLQEVTCDPDQFSRTFFFPSGVNQTAIQHQLCEAVTTQSTAVQQFVDLFTAGDVLVQV
jgi:hypothetical protein